MRRRAERGLVLYEVQRNGNTVIVKKGTLVKLNAPKDSFVIYKEGNDQKVSKLGDLTDEQLLLALVNALDISTHSVK